MKLWARRGFEWAEEGLAGLWCSVLTGATGSTLLDCNPSTSNHGTLTSYTDLNTSRVGTQYGTAIDFNGTNNYVATSTWRGLSGDYSASFWFRTSFATSGATCMLGSSYNGSGGVHILGVRGTDGALYGFAGSERWYGGGYNNNSWVLATVVRRFSDGLGTMFANGISLGSQAGLGTSDPATGAGWRFGGTPFFGSQFPGQIAEIIFHGRMLTLAEHQTAYQAGPGGAWQLTPPSRRYATILANAYTLIAASASYSITGQPVGLLAGRLLAADAASYLLAGNAAGLNAGRLLTADSAAYALNGQDANLLASRLLSGDTATYNLIGNSANLLASRTLQADSAQYTVTGSDAALLAGRLLDCGSSAFLLSPNQAGLLAARKLTADQASLVLSTQATSLYAGRKITAETAQFILIASPVDLTFGGGGAAPYYYLFLLGGSR